MGGSASKAARTLPKSVPSTTRSAPAWVKSDIPSDPLFQSPTPGPSQPRSSQTPQSYESHHHGRLETGSGMGNEPRGKPIGKSTTDFTGEKDDVVRRDALDPHFAANLSRLGPVTINDAGEFRPTLSSAQKTLTARQANAESTNSDIPPPGFTNAHLLSQLLDELKSVRTQNDVNRLYNHYGLDKEQMDVVRRWVNSPSVGDVNVSYAEGGEVTEMKAIWVEKKV